VGCDSEIKETYQYILDKFKSGYKADIPQVAIHFSQFLLITVLNILKILFLYCSGTTYPILTGNAFTCLCKNMHFNKVIIFKNTKSQALATIHHLQK